MSKNCHLFFHRIQIFDLFSVVNNFLAKIESPDAIDPDSSYDTNIEKIDLMTNDLYAY